MKRKIVVTLFVALVCLVPGKAMAGSTVSELAKQVDQHLELLANEREKAAQRVDYLRYRSLEAALQQTLQRLKAETDQLESERARFAVEQIRRALDSLSVTIEDRSRLILALECSLYEQTAGHEAEPCRDIDMSSVGDTEVETQLQTVSLSTSGQSDQAASLDEPDGSPLNVSFFGQAVDLEVGRLFNMMARRSPHLLRPIPIDREYQIKRCVNNNLHFPIVQLTLGHEDEAFRDMLREASVLLEAGGDSFRYTLLQSQIGDMRRRTGLEVPEKLVDFTEEDAFSLITEEAAARFGLDRLDSPKLSAGLRNLWVSLGENEFLAVVSEVTERQVSASEAGSSLAAMDMTDERLWRSLMFHTTKRRHCSDADKIMEAHGLVYKHGDYPLARDTLRKLSSYAGYPAVPGITLLEVERRFLEAEKPNCSLFGPVEELGVGRTGDECHLGEMEVDGVHRYIVNAGGAQLKFWVTDEERDLVVDMLVELADLPREGDKLRWSVDDGAPIRPQTMNPNALSLTPLTYRDEGRRLPCILGMTSADLLSDTQALKRHVDDYRAAFYPPDRSLKPEDLSYIFLIDEFGGHRHRDFQSKMEESARRLGSLYSSYQSLAHQVGENVGDHAGNSVGLGDVPNIDPRMCVVLTEQFRDTEQIQQISHGVFVKSLLIGDASSTSTIDGLGLLNVDGDFREEEFLDHVKEWPVRGKINSVSVHVRNANKRLDDLKTYAQVTGRSAPATAVINISLGETYLNKTETEKVLATSAIDELKDGLALMNENALFVIAAGQPGFDQGAPAGGVAAELQGKRLARMSPKVLTVNTEECSFFPACLSLRKNIITVGALEPSHGAMGYRKPVLSKWANYGPAITVAAPGQGVLANEYGYIMGEQDKLETLSVSSLRDGTSVSAVFVTALAAKLAARYPTLRASEIKKQLIATARPYLPPTEGGEPELLKGEEGFLFAGAIDPVAAMRDPSKYHVVYRAKNADGSRKYQEFEIIRRNDGVKASPLFSVFRSATDSEKEFLKCNWRELLRLHLTPETEMDDRGNEIFQGSVACKDLENTELVKVASGKFGTYNIQQNECISQDNCLKGLTSEGTWLPLKFKEIQDIYFPVVSQ